MPTHHAGNGKQKRFEFIKILKKHIEPVLAPWGFGHIETSPCSAKYQSPNVLLEVLHDPFSYEINVLFSRKAVPSERYSLHDMLQVPSKIPHDEQDFFQASKPDRVNAAAIAISDLLQKYGKGVLAGDLSTYQQIGRIRNEQSAAYEKEMGQQPIRKAAEEAWRNRDYAKARDLYESITSDLTLIEKKRLEYARSHYSPPRI